MLKISSEDALLTTQNVLSRQRSHQSRSQCRDICLKCQPNIRPCKCSSHLRRWLCAGIVLTLNSLLSWQWWRHRERSDRRDTKSESEILNTSLTPSLRCGLLRTLSTLTFWSTIEIVPIHVRRAMPRSVNGCISSVIVLPITVSIWMIFNYYRYDFLPMSYEIVCECSPTCGDIWMWRHLWKSTLVAEEKPAVGINVSSSGKCQQIDFSGIAAWSGRFGSGHVGWSQMQLASWVSLLWNWYCCPPHRVCIFCQTLQTSMHYNLCIIQTAADVVSGPVQPMESLTPN